MNKFLRAGFASGTRFRSPANGYESRNEKMILTGDAEGDRVRRTLAYRKGMGVARSRSSGEAPTVVERAAKAVE